MHLRVILVEPEHDGNVGSVARLMKNFDFSDLWIVNPKSFLGSEAMAYASHAKDLLQTSCIVGSIEEALDGVSLAAGTSSILPKRSANVLRTAVSPEELNRIAETVSGKVAILLGRESRGLSNEELEKCDIVVSIPSSCRYRTLNIASAAAILFYELWKGQVSRPIYIEEADRATRRRLVDMFDTLCREIKLAPNRRRLAVRAFLNVLSRAPSSCRETTLLLGVFRQTLQKLSGDF